MGKNCAICFVTLGEPETSSPYFCLSCYHAFPRSPRQTPAGISLFRYEGAIRDLILRTKVSGDQYALSALRSLVLTSPELAEACSRAHQIIPVPSSLWGRLRGRIDIPWFLARDAALKYQREFSLAPVSLHWRLFKRARRRKNIASSKYEAISLQFSGRLGSIPTLLIDDIVTTGYTLTQVASQLPHAQCSFFTLAEARFDTC